MVTTAPMYRNIQYLLALLFNKPYYTARYIVTRGPKY